jgi:hypothetical protein
MQSQNKKLYTIFRATAIAKVLFILVSMLLIGSCQKEKQSSPEIKSPKQQVITNNIWETYWDNSSKQIRLRPLYKIVNSEEDPKVLIMAFNKSIQTMKFFRSKSGASLTANYQRRSQDTIYIKITNPWVLTQRVGSSGASEYIARLTYTMTELSGITRVHLDFEAGDHASPGYYSRNDFEYRDCLRKH